MEPSKVYFTNLRTDYDNPLPVKLKRLIKRAGIEHIDFADRFVAIRFILASRATSPFCARISLVRWWT